MLINREIWQKVLPLNKGRSCESFVRVVAAAQICSNNNYDTTPIFFLPGWGFDGRIITVMSTVPSWFSPLLPADPLGLLKKLHDFIKKNQINRINLIGWSMGGNLALDFALAYPDKVSKLFLLSVRQSWSKAEIEHIRLTLTSNPQKFLAGFYRNCFLGYKQAYNRFVANLEAQYLEQLDLPILLAGLDYLVEAKISSPPCVEAYSLHGRRDLVVPLVEMAKIKHSKVTIFNHAGHALLMDDNFQLPEKKNKKAIRHNFTKAAATYDAYSDIQQELAGKLVNECRLPLSSPPQSILEIGCGTGNYTLLLAQRFSDADISTLDFSQQMVEMARLKLAPISSRIKFICEDGESFLAAAPSSFDLITSNATMQWFDNIDYAFFNIKKLLTTGGLFKGSLFGPQTLQELALGLTQLFGQQIRLPAVDFLSRATLHNMLCKHFKIVLTSEWMVQRQYKSLIDLLLHIKKTGATGGHYKPLPFTRGRLKKLDDWFLAQYGGYRVSYQTYLLMVCK